MSLMESIMLRFGYVKVAKHPEQSAEVASSDDNWVPPPPGSPPLRFGTERGAATPRHAGPPPVPVNPRPARCVAQSPEPSPEPSPAPPTEQEPDEWEWELAMARARARAEEANDEWEWQLAMARARAAAGDVSPAPKAEGSLVTRKEEAESEAETPSPKAEAKAPKTQAKTANAPAAQRPLSSYLAGARHSEPAGAPRRRLARGTDTQHSGTSRRVPLVRAPRLKPAPTAVPSGLRSRGLRQMVSSAGRR